MELRVHTSILFYHFYPAPSFIVQLLLSFVWFWSLTRHRPYTESIPPYYPVASCWYKVVLLIAILIVTRLWPWPTVVVDRSLLPTYIYIIFLYFYVYMSTALSIKEDYWSPKGCSFVRITTLEALRHLCSAKARFIMLHLRSTTCPRREDPLQKGNQHSFTSHIAMMAASQLFSLWPSSLKQHIYIYMHIHMHIHLNHRLVSQGLTTDQSRFLYLIWYTQSSSSPTSKKVISV